MNVSRETQQKLNDYLELLRKWSPRINLVSPATLKTAATRHFADSLQIADLAGPAVKTWVDLGSGGGFPGAVVAIVLQEKMPDLSVTLIESDQRKATFLRTVSRETKTSFKVLAQRIEDAEPQNADILSARALAPLDDLCRMAERHLSPSGKALFPKGETWQQEVDQAQKRWRFSLKTHKSETSSLAAILEIGDLTRA